MRTKILYPLKRSADYQFNLYSIFIGCLLIACCINSCGSSVVAKNKLHTTPTVVVIK